MIFLSDQAASASSPDAFWPDSILADVQLRAETDSVFWVLKL